jgi:hypothetical protein
MNDDTSNETTGTEEEGELLGRRLFLQSMGKWSGAAIAAAVFGGAWLAFPPEANAGAWESIAGAVTALDGSTEAVVAAEDG